VGDVSKWGIATRWTTVSLKIVPFTQTGEDYKCAFGVYIDAGI
jgi:hypothetical protein